MVMEAAARSWITGGVVIVPAAAVVEFFDELRCLHMAATRKLETRTVHDSSYVRVAFQKAIAGGGRCYYSSQGALQLGSGAVISLVDRGR